MKLVAKISITIPVAGLDALEAAINEGGGEITMLNINDEEGKIPTTRTRNRSGNNTRVTKALVKKVKGIEGSAARIGTQLGLGKSTVEGIRRGEYDHV